MRLNTAAIIGLAALICTPAFAGATAIKPKLIVTGLSLPTTIASVPGDTTRLFVVEKRGAIRIINLTTTTPTLLTTPFLDIDALVSGSQTVGDEQGMLGLTFDPDYATNGQFYVYYTGATSPATNKLARYQVSSNPNVALTTGVVMMTWTDPYSNHNGGCIQFKPGTRNLYMGTGDGGSANDPSGNAQNLLSAHGKMHRITPTVGGVAPYYTIPAGNPFAGGSTTADDTIWAYGLRNPWRWSFDRLTGDQYIADVGQNAVEEVDFEPSNSVGGRNYGWRCTEGTSCTGLSGCVCNGTTLTPPVRTYGHNSAGGYSITGGYVYRGCAMPNMQGIYFYADYATNNSWSMKMVNGVVTEFVTRNSELQVALGGQTVNQISSFGEDANGEIYIADLGGQIYKIVPATGEVACTPPTNPADLNHDGFVDGVDLTTLLSCWGDFICGDINQDGYTDGADLAALLSAWGS